MSEKIKAIPTEELQDDLVAATEDKDNCEFAMNQGIFMYKSQRDGTINNVSERYMANLRQIHMIQEELERRGEPYAHS